MSRRLIRGGIIGGMLLGTASLVPALALAAGTTQSPPPAPQAQAQPAPATTQQKTTAPSKPMATGKAAASGETMSSERGKVRMAQEALNKQGASLKVDGKLGYKTREALKSFQQKNGLTPSGRLDKATEAALKVA